MRFSVIDRFEEKRILRRGTNDIPQAKESRAKKLARDSSYSQQRFEIEPMRNPCFSNIGVCHEYQWKTEIAKLKKKKAPIISK
jgi:hypothetical protein